MKPGKKRFADPPVEKALSLPSSLVAEVELRLYDPATQKVKYGAFAQLVERLLREWLVKGAPSATPTEVPPNSTSRPAENPGAGENP